MLGPKSWQSRNNIYACCGLFGSQQCFIPPTPLCVCVCCGLKLAGHFPWLCLASVYVVLIDWNLNEHTSLIEVGSGCKLSLRYAERWKRVPAVYGSVGCSSQLLELSCWSLRPLYQFFIVIYCSLLCQIGASLTLVHLRDNKSALIVVLQYGLTSGDTLPFQVSSDICGFKPIIFLEKWDKNGYMIVVCKIMYVGLDQWTW